MTSPEKKKARELMKLFSTKEDVLEHIKQVLIIISRYRLKKFYSSVANEVKKL